MHPSMSSAHYLSSSTRAPKTVSLFNCFIFVCLVTLSFTVNLSLPEEEKREKPIVVSTEKLTRLLLLLLLLQCAAQSIDWKDSALVLIAIHLNAQSLAVNRERKTERKKESTRVHNTAVSVAAGNYN